MVKSLNLILKLAVVVGVFFVLGCDGGSIIPEKEEQPYLPVSDPNNIMNWTFIPEFSDEFDSNTVDSTKWNKGYPYWNGRYPSWFVDNNVKVKDGKLQITMKKEVLPEMDSGYEYSTGILRHKKSFLYGYTEIKAKCMNSAGSSAFWLNNATSEWWTEIDVFEIGGNAKNHEYSVHTNAHEFYNPENVIDPFDPDTKTHYDTSMVKKMSWRPDSDYHIYGVEWSEKSIKWYVDGDMIREIENSRWSQELFINIDSEVMQEWWGLPVDTDLPSTFYVEYIRTWQ